MEEWREGRDEEVEGCIKVGVEGWRKGSNEGKVGMEGKWR